MIIKPQENQNIISYSQFLSKHDSKGVGYSIGVSNFAYATGLDACLQ
jgi:hypothetical protein